jgi:hypothetical protein
MIVEMQFGIKEDTSISELDYLYISRRGLRAGRLEFEARKGQEAFPYFAESRLAMENTRPPIP